MTLNERAAAIVNSMLGDAADLRVAVHNVGGARIIDAGLAIEGGMQAGLLLARVCLADRGTVVFAPGNADSLGLPLVHVASDDPVRACLASQYAGWQIAVGKYFAMGSGPMRAHYGKEELFDHIQCREMAPVAVGVLEGRKLPTPEVVEWLTEKLKLPAEALTLLIAPTASLAGTVQIVARALETAMHKLHELKFDVNRIISGLGVAPLAPPAKDDMAGIGRTNDAILYGGRVQLWVRADDAELEAIGPKSPASASSEYGRPFADIFKSAGHDFYKLDPLLFAPAVVTFHNLASGRSWTFGKMNEAVMRQSFGM